MKIRIVVLVVLGVAGASSAASAQRHGLHLALGAGGGVGAWDISVEGRRENSGAGSVLTDFEVGLSVSPQLDVYYFQRTAWFNSDVTILPGPFGGPETPQQVGRALTQGVSGVGATYYLTPRTPALYLSAGVGLAWWSQVFEESEDCFKFPLVFPCVDVSGVGLSVGAGYDMTRRLALGLVGTWAHPSGGGSRFNVVANATSVGLLLRFKLF